MSWYNDCTYSYSTTSGTADWYVGPHYKHSSAYQSYLQMQEQVKQQAIEKEKRIAREKEIRENPLFHWRETCKK